MRIRRPHLGHDIVLSTDAVCILVVSGFRQVFVAGTVLASSLGSISWVREGLTRLRAQSDRELRREDGNNWTVHKHLVSPPSQQVSRTHMRRSHSRTNDATIRVHSDMNGVDGGLCGATIRVVCSALIDEVQEMPQ
jgi:hypothetical protein